MKRFINDDVKLRNGGRNAIRTTEKELEDKIIKKAQSIAKKDEYYDDEEEIDWLRDALYILFEDDSIRKDRKFLVDMENIMYEDYPINALDIGENLVGFHTLENGFTFLGILMGGDWEWPVFVILYDDGKRIRCYSPSYGNIVNLDTKTAFGSEDACDFDFNKLFLTYQKQKLVDYDDTNKDVSFYSINWSGAYFQKYGLDEKSVGFNWDAIKQDIMSRISLI